MRRTIKNIILIIIVLMFYKCSLFKEDYDNNQNKCRFLLKNFLENYKRLNDSLKYLNSNYILFRIGWGGCTQNLNETLFIFIQEGNEIKVNKFNIFEKYPNTVILSSDLFSKIENLAEKIKDDTLKIISEPTSTIWKFYNIIIKINDKFLELELFEDNFEKNEYYDKLVSILKTELFDNELEKIWERKYQ